MKPFTAPSVGKVLLLPRLSLAPPSCTCCTFMQYYSRTQPATRGAAPAVPGTAFTPDGKLHLAVPARRAAAAGSSSGDTQQGGPGRK